MTGFARARRHLGHSELIVSVKTVNHRGLDIQIHAPSSVDPFESAIRSRVKAQIVRGHADIRISLPDFSHNGETTSVNHELLEEYVRAFREAATRHCLESQPDLNAALRLPGMFGEPSNGEAPPETEGLLLEALDEALDGLNVFRAREGSEICTEMLRHNRQIAESADTIERIRSVAVCSFQIRLTERLNELLKGVQIEPQRLAQEAAILADRSDVSEELARLRIHSNQLAKLLEGGGEVGKKLDFLLQEMNRESNTILSKTSGIGDTGLKITDLALAAKAAIEKIREQSLNLE
jgi:uncharacterized protein (TIGR00255 family)